MKTTLEIKHLAEERFPKDSPFGLKTDIDVYKQRGFIQGYLKCQKDTAKNEYTKEDMEKAFKYGRTLEPFDCFEDFIESLNI